MIELKIKNEETVRQFNLKNTEREIALVSAWKAMAGDEKYGVKKIKITTHTGDTFQIRINDIENCKFEDCTYCEGDVHI